jgi:hypothetical protein
VKETTSKAHMQVHTNKESCEKQQGRNLSGTGPKRVWADRPSPFRARFGAPFDLAASWAIYSPLAESHKEERFVIHRRGLEKKGTSFWRGDGRDG